MYIEFKTPGFGLPGTAGAVLLLIYFFGHYVAGLAGIESIVLVMLGLVLLAVEVFFVPGFGVIGLLGILCMVAGIIMGLVPQQLPTDVPALPDLAPLDLTEYVRAALARFLTSAALGALGIWALSRILPRTSIYRHLVLQKTLTQGDGFVSSNSSKYRLFLGHVGIAETLLRPAGVATIDGERLDVVSSGDYIPQGARVRVIQAEGGRVVVERVSDAPGPVAETPSQSAAPG
jgi:membrane-bound serine protease (ClpP class)